MATYRHWSVSLWRDPDNVSHCGILSPDKTEWRLISAILCGWGHYFVADQLWLMTRIREEATCDQGKGKGKGAYSSSWNSPQNYGTPLVNGITVLYANRQRWPPRLHPNRAGSYSIYRPRKDEWLSWPSWLVIYRNGLPIHRQSPILVLTGSDVAQLRWSKPTRYHQAKPPTAKPNRQPSPVNELTSHSGQLNLAILLWVGKMNTGSGYGHCWGRTASPV